MFGQGYSEVREDLLSVGDYEVTITNATVKQYNNGNQFVELTFGVKGHRADCRPNSYVINDRPLINTVKANGTQVTDKDLASWDKSMTKFFDTFSITAGDFNFRNWIGKKGVVHCDWQYDSKEPDKKSKIYKCFYCNVQKDNADTTTSLSNLQSTTTTQDSARLDALEDKILF